MLSDSQKQIIQATVPLLETGGEALTTHFYQMMLSEYPEVRPLFNQAHQQSGAQPRALAHSVLMYAKHIDRLENLGDLPAQIINKHVALQVQPDQYQIVGSCLLRAIREVLGAEIATDAVIDAWAAAYTQLADILIAAEAKAYDDIAHAEGGWRGARTFKLVQKVAESAEISSFYLEPVDGKAVIAHQPGQYIGLRAIVGGTEQRRNYSLSAPSNGRSYRISVKREPGGKVSNYLHDLQVGDTLELFAPAGHFTLQAGERPLVLISGGVGITPTLPMLEAALQTDRPVTFIHCARGRAVHAFRPQIDALAQAHSQLQPLYVYEEVADGEAVAAQGRLTEDLLGQWLPASRDADVYFLGPKPFMRSVKASLRKLGVPDAQVRYEFFGPAEALA